MAVTIHHTGNWKEAAAAEYAERRAALVRQRDKAVKTLASLQRKVSQTDAEIAELDRGAKVFGLPVPDNITHLLPLGDTASGADNAVVISANLNRIMAAHHGGGRQFKDVALEYLAQAYPNSVKAADVQEAVEAELGRKFHWKTAGMTLYRLKTDGCATRDGQWWRYVPLEQQAAAREYEQARIEERRREMAEGSDDEGPDDLGEVLG